MVYLQSVCSYSVRGIICHVGMGNGEATCTSCHCMLSSFRVNAQGCALAFKCFSFQTCTLYVACICTLVVYRTVCL